MTQPTIPEHRTLEQRRAKHAWDCVEKVDENPSQDFKKDYGSLVRGLPALIQSDGLGQMLAFLRAVDGRSKWKGETAEIEAYRHISGWIAQEFSLTYGANETLMGWLLHQSTLEYRRTSAEVMAYLSWLKRFAEAKGWKKEGK